MKSDKEIEDEVLGRWLAGEMSNEELAEFEKSDAFHSYQLIADYSDQLTVENYDIESELQKLKEKTSKPKVFKMSAYQKFGIAAGIALLIGIGAYLLFDNAGTDSTNLYSTAQGQTTEHILPDQSVVSLNVASTIEYDEVNWDKNRELHLKGEAYFDVEKGSKFTVSTSDGRIEVLGTEFNIRSRQNVTEVICYEGKVLVTDLKSSEIILNPGEGIRIEDGELSQDWTPVITEEVEWQNGYSAFHKTPFSNVIEELENQYELHVELNESITNRNYVGTFPHDDLQKAAELVFKPMDFSYTIIGDSLIVID